jgi:glutamyl-tRNA synthetase
MGVGQVSNVRVRFAPSPTGYLHIGGARTALFNWLFARHHNGVFILRIEDTDIKRSEDKYLEEILDSLKWLGMDWDEGPYFQSKRFDLYKEYAERLIKQGDAYLTSEEGEEGKTKAVRFKIPREIVYIDDLIHSRIQFDNSLIEDDLVIMKSDGSPTYNFACVIDDATLGITHVIRGDDHISNTPKQLPLYKALGFDMPKFAHIPLILGEDRSRLSKRHGAASVTSYREEGYLHEAVVNYLALLGWSPGKDIEILPVTEIIEKFELSNVNKTNAVFNIDKLKWMNGQYIRLTPVENLYDLLVPLLKESNLCNESPDREKIINVIKLLQKRIFTLREFIPQARIFFESKVEFAEGAKEKYLTNQNVRNWFTELINVLNSITSFDIETLEKEFRALTTRLGIKTGELVHPTRVALTGRTVGPGLFETMHLLGKETIIRRLREYTAL